MRKFAILTIASVVLCSCSTLAQVEQLIPDEEGTPATVVDARALGGWFLSPDEPAERMCSGLVSDTALPCREVLNICGDDGTTVWLPQQFVCTSSSPRWRDVCATRPASEWAFYALAPERCAELLA